jgi:hypothetical protein
MNCVFLDELQQFREFLIANHVTIEPVTDEREVLRYRLDETGRQLSIVQRH